MEPRDTGAIPQQDLLPANCACATTPKTPNPQEVEPHLNLGPFLNRAPATVRLETPATRVHSMMLGLSLRWDFLACGCGIPERGAACTLQMVC